MGPEAKNGRERWPLRFKTTEIWDLKDRELVRNRECDTGTKTLSGKHGHSLEELQRQSLREKRGQEARVRKTVSQ